MNKRLLSKILSATLIMLLCGISSIFAQNIPNIPTDPDVRIGKLSNGLTYYIRKDTLPKNRAFFYIAQKVGAIQEEPQQRGLAHFLEHMCFNGTKHFPGDALKQYLERIGVKFGENLNAYTAIDETVYNINNVPTTVPFAIDSCLLILHDWSHDLTLDPAEIDKERGVIHEEWRMRNNARQRIQEAMMPVIMAGSKYSDSMPIGSMDVVMNFKPQTLRDYYEKWYRPDLQGIVIVGDIDVNQVEAKIKKEFADITDKPNAAKRIYYSVPDNKEPIVFIGKDKELTSTDFTIFFKHSAVPDSDKSKLTYLIQGYAENIMSRMLNARYNEILQKSNPPFVGAGAEDSKFFVAKNNDAFTASVSCKEGEIEKGITAMLREVYRAKQFGFTATEYDRARTDYLAEIQSAYNDRNKQESESFINGYVRNFLDNEPIPSITQVYTIANQIFPKIPVSVINSLLPSFISDSDMVVVLDMPEKVGLAVPTKEQLLDYVNKAKSEKLTAYVDKVSNEPLMTVKPKAGRILSTVNAADGTTVMKLSNGAKVVIKKTDFKQDEINMTAVSKGGTSLYPDNEVLDAKNINDVIALGGLGKFSSTDLSKMLSGKIASVNAKVSAISESVSAGCAPKDLETMMQLIYLQYTSPRKDEAAFESYKTRLKAELKNSEMLPETAFQDTIVKAFYGNNPRAFRIKENMVDKINYDKILNMYKDRFKDAGNFTFYFVGNVNLDTIKPLIAQYIASLPTVPRKETYVPRMYMRKGIYTNNFIKEQETPKSTLLMVLSGKVPYTLKNALTADMLGQILDIVYTQTIREDAGAAYSVSVDGGATYYPESQASLEIYFPTDPSKRDLTMKLTIEGLEDLIKNGPSQKNLDKVKEFKLKKHAEDIKTNGYWMGIMLNEYMSGINSSKGYDDIVKSITTKDIQDFAAALYKQNNRITVSMTSPKKK